MSSLRSLARRLGSAATAPQTIRSQPTRRAIHASSSRLHEAVNIAARASSSGAGNPTSGPRSQTPDPVSVSVEGKTLSFPALFLRDACRCSKCVDPSTQQKLFQTSDIPPNLGVADQSLSADGSLRLSWTNDHPAMAGEEHVTELPLKWLQESTARTERLRRSRAPIRRRTTWDRQRMQQDNLWVEYDKYATSDSELLRTLQQLQTHGLVFIRNVPDDETSVVSIAERIGPLRDSFYGRTWNVRSVPDAKNIAYTHQYLGLHMDLLYMTNPPHLQLLHSLRAQAPGGESLFSDAFHAAELIRRDHPESFLALAQHPVTYHYENASQHYEATRPTIELELAGIVGGHGGHRISPSNFGRAGLAEEDARAPHSTSAVSRMNWSPPFQGPFQQDIDSLADYHRAANMLSELVNADENVFEYRLAEGECVIFDNRRVLHARKAFDIAGGERWLKGAYVDDDVYWSRLRVLEEANEHVPA